MNLGEGVLILAGGTDPSGGAGLPADIRSSAAMGMHGCPVVTAITVQDSGSVISWEAVDPSLLLAQLSSVADDGPVSGIKSGMLGSAANISVLADFIRDRLWPLPYVLDPVAVSGSGTPLLPGDAMEEMVRSLLPLCSLLTPNIGEAALLAGMDGIKDAGSMEAAGRRILSMGPGAVLVKGGHLEGDPVDVLVSGGETVEFRGTRITGDNVHGTGCTLASACASLMASGFPVKKAVAEARKYVERTIARRMPRRKGFLPGHFPGRGPVPPNQDGTSFYLPPAYCSGCGGVLEDTPGQGGHLHCRECGFIHYRNPLPAVALLLSEGDRILLVRRAVPPAMNMLCLPGGFMELDETPRECGRRELLEETGLELEESRIFALKTDSTAYGGILLVALEALSWSGEPRPGDDASEVVWCPLSRVPGLAFDAHRRLVEELTGRHSK